MALPARLRPLPIPTRRWIAKKRWPVAPAVLCGLFISLLSVRFLVAPVDRFDEGLTVTRAMLVAAGRLPYRDFWTSYGPLDSMLLGFLFRLFGQDILVERVLAVAVALALAGLAFYACVLGLMLAVGAVVCFLCALEQRDWRLFALAGGMTALTSLARPELGLVIGAGLGAGQLLALWRRSVRPADVLAFCGGAIFLGAVLWVPFAIIASPQALFFDVVVHALVLFPSGRRIPLGQGGDAAAVLVFSACFLLVWLWGMIRLVRRPNEAETPRLLALLGCAIP